MIRGLEICVQWANEEPQTVSVWGQHLTSLVSSGNSKDVAKIMCTTGFSLGGCKSLRWMEVTAAQWDLVPQSCVLADG